MKVLVFDPYVDDTTITSFGGLKVATLEEGLKKADILSLSLPLNSETKNLITLKEMKLMKKSSIIINAARGGIVNEEDLNNALDNNIIAFAGIIMIELFFISFISFKVIKFLVLLFRGKLNDKISAFFKPPLRVEILTPPKDVIVVTST